MASCRDCPCDSASCRESRQEAKSHGQSLQKAISQAQQSWQETRDRGQSRPKPNMTDSLCRKRKLADSYIPCVLYIVYSHAVLGTWSRAPDKRGTGTEDNSKILFLLSQ